MRPMSHAFKTLLAAVIPSLLLLAPAAGLAGTVVPVERFRSVKLRNGGEVVLKYSPTTQRVTVMGSPEYTTTTVMEGGELVIQNDGCPKGYRMVVEVLTPDLEGVMVSDGGTIRSVEGFPRRAALNVAVASGGVVDLRSMTVDQVTAAVQQGGRILTRPREALVAAVAHGGAIVYWGNPHVTSSIQKGGVVTKGAAEDLDRPLPDLGITATPVPPAPPVAPAPAKRVRRIST